MKWKLTITTRSFLLAGSGEGSALVDSDIIFHKSGFPYIPARRVKGLLKESAEEVLEILGKEDGEIGRKLAALFGKSGVETNTGKLIFPNLYVEGWAAIKQELYGQADGNGQRHSWDPGAIRAHYTTEIRQTSIAAKTGTAEDGSLRNYRVVNPGQRFVAEITVNKELSEDERRLLEKAALNLRCAGTRRNRGFGNILCKLTPGEEGREPADAKAASLSNGSSLDTAEPEARESLSLSLQTLSPVVLALQLGDQNTVYSEKYISGSRLRGILVQQYMRIRGLEKENAHLDDRFFALFLSGAIIFHPLYFESSIPLPLYVHRFKGADKKDLINVFKNEKEGKKISRALGGTGYCKGKEIQHKEPATSFFFHNSREDRSAGSSTKEQVEGGIFYYEAIEEDQQFSGCLQGPKSLLQDLAATLGRKFRAQAGKSRSAQYGEVALMLSEAQDSGIALVAPSASVTYVLTLESPLVLLNEQGEAEPGEKTLLYYIRSGLVKQSVEKAASVEIRNAAAGFALAEQYNNSWQAKSGKIPVYKEGSSFLLQFDSSVSCVQLAGMQKEDLGEWTEQGFGKIRWEAYEEAPDKYTLDTHDGDTTKQAGEKTKSPAFSNPVLRAIQAKAASEKLSVSEKTAAIKDASEFTRSLNSHLIGRLERMITEIDTREGITTWINALEGKPAWNSLQDARLLKKLQEFDRGGETEKEKLDLSKAYWITFFRTLRKKNKQKKTNQLTNGRTS